MTNSNDGTLTMHDARIVFRNFAGKEGMYNREGDRNFCLLLDEQLAQQMGADGWNIKTLNQRNEDDPIQPYIQVSVGFKGRPPKLVLISSRGRADLRQDECELLDWVDIKKADLIVRPYNWGPINGKTGIKAYLKSLFITINEDELELEYADVPYAAELEAPSETLQITAGRIVVPPREPLQIASGREDDDVIDGEIVENDDA